jgi:hypothetical protein
MLEYIISLLIIIVCYLSILVGISKIGIYFVPSIIMIISGSIIILGSFVAIIYDIFYNHNIKPNDDTSYVLVQNNIETV